MISERVTLFADYGCPLGQRIEALLVLHDLPYQLCAVDPAHKPKELLELSPSGRIPLVQVGAVTLYESAVIADYLAERLGWLEAYPGDADGRAKHRVAIRRFDSMWQTALRGASGKAPGAKELLRVDEDLEHIAATIERHSSQVPSMLLLTAVPIWQRLSWLEPVSDLASRVRRHPNLVHWLERGAELPALVATTPIKERVLSTHLGNTARPY